MFFEYIQLSGYGGAFLSVDFISKIAFLILGCLVLAGLGYKIKGTTGAIVALLLAVLYILYNERIVKF